MAINQIHVGVLPEAVFALLRDPRRYPEWLVGAKRIRSFDPRWPEPGTEFHHTMGAGPATIDDRTSVVAADPPAQFADVPGDGQLVLRARAMPVGVAEVRIVVCEESSPTRPGSRVQMREWAIDGIGARINNPLIDAAIHLRNAVSLRRLRRLLEGEGAR